MAALPLVRSLDITRLVLLSSGRFDGHLDIGSVSNPELLRWEYVWGKEDAGRASLPCNIPPDRVLETSTFIPKFRKRRRSTDDADSGKDSKPVFLSEYGIGSMMNVIHEVRMYEQAGIPEDAEDFVLMQAHGRRIYSGLGAFWHGVGLPISGNPAGDEPGSDGAPSPGGLQSIRSNPKICGFNLTGMLDHAMTGEGVWRFWRDWKPGVIRCDAGWMGAGTVVPIRRADAYLQLAAPITLEAVLANEDACTRAVYRSNSESWGPKGLRVAVTNLYDSGVPNVPLAMPVLQGTDHVRRPAGSYELCRISFGVAPPETSLKFTIMTCIAIPNSITRNNNRTSTRQNVESWLTPRSKQLRRAQQQSWRGPE